MSAQHTPGPWRDAYEDDNGQAVIMGEHTEVATCWHHCVGSLEKQMRANARLIASAPELLAALVDILGPLNVCTDNPNVRDDQCLPVDMTMGELRAARAAILKATGGTA